MKKYFILLLISCLFDLQSSNAQSFLWAKNMGGTGWDRSRLIARDLSGNIYIGGSIQDEPQAIFETDTLEINGTNDFFIAKYDNLGNQIWVRSFGGPNFVIFPTNKPEGVAQLIFDPISNSLFACGQYYESCLFGTITLTTTTNDLQLYYLKMDLDGNCIWVKNIGSLGDDNNVRIAVADNSEIFIECSIVYNGVIDTMSIPGGTFLAKCDSSGNPLWAKRISFNTQSGDDKYAVRDIQYSGNSIYMYGLMAYDSLTLDTIQIYSPGYKGKILSKWDTNGNIVWYKKFGGPLWGNAAYDAINIVDNGNFIVSGSFLGAYATFEDDTLFSNSINTESYFAKYDSSGQKVWLKQLHSKNSSGIADSYTDVNGFIYLTGYFSMSAVFGSDTVYASSAYDIFISKYDSTGNLIGMRNLGEGNGLGITCDASGNAYVTGFIEGSVNFDSHSLITYGSQDIFLAKLDAITGIEESERIKNNALVIYANPSVGKCTILIPEELKNKQNLTLSIFDIAGKIIQSSVINYREGKIKINLEQEAKGTYVVILTDGNTKFNGRIIFE